MAQAVIFHYRANENFLSSLNPNTKLIALLSYTTVITTAKAESVFILALFPLFLAIMIRLPWRSYLKESIFFIFLAIVMGLSEYISGNGMLKATAKTVSFCSMILSSMLLTDTTMPDELSRSLGSALSHVLGRYAYSLAAVMEITLSMIPLIIDSSSCMFEARKARGASFLSHPIRFLSELTASILSDLIDRTEAYVDALISRGYDPSKRKTCRQYGKRDFLIILLSLIVLITNTITKYVR